MECVSAYLKGRAWVLPNWQASQKHGFSFIEYFSLQFLRFWCKTLTNGWPSLLWQASWTKALLKTPLLDWKQEDTEVEQTLSKQSLSIKWIGHDVGLLKSERMYASRNE